MRITNTHRTDTDKEQFGFMSVEALLAAALFGAVVVAVVGSLIYGRESTALAGTRTRGIFLAQEGLEAARNLRDQDPILLSGLTLGPHGLASSSNQWVFSGVSDTAGIYTRVVTVATTSSSTVRLVTSQVTWQQNAQRPGTTTLQTYMSNWYQSTTQGGALIVGTSTAVLANSNLDVTGITLTNATSSAITVGKMTVTWTNAARKISQILINGTTVWSSVGPGTPTSTQLSGVLLDIQDIVLAAATTTPLTRLRFDGAMTGNTFTITFTMGDATTKVANSIVL